MKSITENTTISIGVLILIAGGISWLTSLYADVQVQGKQITQLEESQSELQKDVKEILENTYQIKSELKVIKTTTTIKQVR
jgi:hypothetical protein